MLAMMIATTRTVAVAVAARAVVVVVAVMVVAETEAAGESVLVAVVAAVVVLLLLLLLLPCSSRHGLRRRCHRHYRPRPFGGGKSRQRAEQGSTRCLCRSKRSSSSKLTTRQVFSSGKKKNQECNFGSLNRPHSIRN
jgi:hypothetical protein